MSVDSYHCPRCGSVKVEETTMGGPPTGEPPRFDDLNRATCTECKHRGTVGDWQRIAELRAYELRGST